MNPMIEVNNVSKKYGNKIALDNISFTIITGLEINNKI